MTTFAGLILAGGAGRRYGRPKAAATLPDGQTFLNACAGVLGEGGARVIVATIRPGLSIAPTTAFTQTELPDPDVDMFGSLRHGLHRLLQMGDWPRAVILPVDHPLVAASTIRAVGETTGPASIPSFNGKHGHPIGLSRTVCKGIVTGRFPGPTLRDVIRKTGHCDVEVDDSGVGANCNTPEKLAAALRVSSLNEPK